MSLLLTLAKIGAEGVAPLVLAVHEEFIAGTNQIIHGTPADTVAGASNWTVWENAGGTSTDNFRRYAGAGRWDATGGTGRARIENGARVRKAEFVTTYGTGTGTWRREAGPIIKQPTGNNANATTYMLLRFGNIYNATGEIACVVDGVVVYILVGAGKTPGTQYRLTIAEEDGATNFYVDDVLLFSHPGLSVETADSQRSGWYSSEINTSGLSNWQSFKSWI